MIFKAHSTLESENLHIYLFQFLSTALTKVAPTSISNTLPMRAVILALSKDLHYGEHDSTLNAYIQAIEYYHNQNDPRT